jgi:hypothetical protein
MERTRHTQEPIRTEDCTRCGGSGLYGSIGTCFRCHGAGTVTIYRDLTPQQLAHNAAQVEAERAEEDAARHARLAARKEARRRQEQR